MLSLASIVLATSVMVGQADNTLKEYGKVVVGNWTGEGTLKGDLPGIGEGGDHVKGNAKTRWVLKKTAVQCDWKFGDSDGKWIAVWDAEKSVIRAYFFNSAGNFAKGTISKKGDNWISNWEGASGEGKHSSGIAVLSIADNGDTVIWDETEQILGDAKLSDFRHVWKRKTK